MHEVGKPKNQASIFQKKLLFHSVGYMEYPLVDSSLETDSVKCGRLLTAICFPCLPMRCVELKGILLGHNSDVEVPLKHLWQGDPYLAHPTVHVTFQFVNLEMKLSLKKSN